jgi:hypothetical protein|tara:strand:+ start:214 stop:3972 length:3759 start_codon:yes stop_codon:yes gene_type:complete
MRLTNYQKKYVKLYKNRYPQRRAYIKSTGGWTQGFKTFMRRKVRKNPSIVLFTQPNLVYNQATGGFPLKRTVYTQKGNLRARFKHLVQVKPNVRKQTKTLNVMKKIPPFQITSTKLDDFKNFTIRNYSTTSPNVTLETIYQTAINAGAGAGGKYLLLRFIHSTTEKYQYISITPRYLKNFFIFKQRVEEIEQGDNDGSGIIGEANWNVSTDGFRIQEFKAEGQGKSNYMLFKVEGIEMKKDKKKISFCGRECLLKCGLKEKDLDYYCIPMRKRHCECKKCGHIGEMICCNKKESKYFKKGLYFCENQDCKQFNEFDIIGEKMKPDFRFLDDILDLIKNKKLKINVISNSLNFVKNTTQLIDSKEEIEIEWIDKNDKKKIVNRRDLVRLENKDINFKKLNYFHRVDEDENAEHTIIYCDNKSHFDLIKNNKLEIDNLYLSDRLEIFRGDEDKEEYKKLFRAIQIFNTNGSPKHYNLYYVFFDFETINSWDSLLGLVEYSLASLIVKADKKTYDLEKILGRIKNMKQMKRTKHCNVFVGWNCVEKFVDYLLKFVEKNSKVMFKFVSYNGCNFDNIILLNKLLKMNKLDKYAERLNISNIFYNGSQLLNFKINRRHHFFDVAKFLSGSLAKNCEDFDLPKSMCKKGFDHHYVQMLYDDKKLDGLLNNENSEFYKKLYEYNAFDVISLSLIFFKMIDALKTIPECCKYITSSNIPVTIGSLVYKMFSDWKTKKKIGLPKLSYEIYTKMNKYKIAGRVDTFYGNNIVNESMDSLDYCSMYPYNMACNSVWYPYGTDKDVIETNKYYKPPNENSKANDETKIGFYEVTFNQQVLKDKNLPNIYAEKIFQYKKTENKYTNVCLKNDWNTTNTLENYFLSNIMIQLLIDNGVDVKIGKGLVFMKKIKNYQLFHPVLNLMKGKNEQDLLKTSEDPQYNPALRQMFKLLANSLSGKIIERLHTEKTAVLNSTKEFYTIQDKVGQKNITAINIIGDKLFTTYKVKEEDIINQQRPIYLAILVYDYSKRMMWNLMKDIGLKECIYADTDALKMKSKISKKLIKDKLSKMIVPHWPYLEQIDERYKTHKMYEPKSKVFGSLENELKDNNILYKVAKKSYLSAHTKGIENYYKDPIKYKKYKPKMSFKGINERGIIIDNLDQDFIDKKTIKHKDGTTEIKYSVKNQYKAYYYINDNPNKTIGRNHIKFFEDLIKNKVVYVLSNSLRKIIKNTIIATPEETEKMINNNIIQSVTILKKIKLEEFNQI